MDCALTRNSFEFIAINSMLTEDVVKTGNLRMKKTTKKCYILRFEIRILYNIWLKLCIRQKVKIGF